MWRAPVGRAAGRGSLRSTMSIVQSFHAALDADAELPMPIAAIYALSDMISKSGAETTSELMESIKHASEELKASLPNPIPASAGLELFMRFVTTKNWAGGVRSGRGCAGLLTYRTLRRTSRTSSPWRSTLPTTLCPTAAVSYTHLTLPTICSV